ncbi:MAG: 50S ribosomal protein L11 methyltransferase [Magnetococcales bacterium]|nr:50S ribosomal protein L11 methyltransferase [Magnetococcales bacterium]
MIYELCFVAPQTLDAPLSELLTAAGSMGVVLEDVGHKAVFSPTVHFERCQFKGYFAEEVNRQGVELAIRAVLMGHGERGDCEVHWIPLADQDWQNHWKRYFQPILVGKRLLVLPSWLEPPAEGAGRLIIRMDPEMAFGSGRHETTRGCLEALEQVAALGPLGRVLDMGTGSGILLIGALLLGAEQGLGVDLDPVAVETCLRNCRINLETMNNFETRLTVKQDDQLPMEPFQTVLANILAPDLIAFLSQTPVQFRHCVAMGGHLLLSGILSEQAQAVENCAHQNGFVTVAHQTIAEWSVLVLRREQERSDPT